MASRRRLPMAAVNIACAVVALDSARRARRHRVDASEERVFRWFNSRSGRIEKPVWAIMQSGSLGAVVATAGLVARRRDARSALPVLVTGAGVWLGAKAVKPIVGRGRPEEYVDAVNVRAGRQTGLGYPSGHAAVALTVASIAPRALDRSQPSLRVPLAVGLASATGAARMYVGAHLPLDVIGGFAIGAIAGQLGSAWCDRMLGRVGE